MQVKAYHYVTNQNLETYKSVAHHDKILIFIYYLQIIDSKDSMESRPHPPKRKEPSSYSGQGAPDGSTVDSLTCKKARLTTSANVEYSSSEQASCSQHDILQENRVRNAERNLDSSDVESDDSADVSVGSYSRNQVLLFADIDISSNFHRQNPRESIENDIFDTSVQQATAQNSNTPAVAVRDRNAYNLHRWQSKHIAKSIVDNAINMTLEEMGVSPETEADVFKREKTEIETFGISHAIQSQGLSTQLPNPLVTSSSSTVISSMAENGTSRSDRQFPTDPQPIVIKVNEKESSMGDSALQNADQNSLINQAVTMAICSQGLVMKNS